MKILVFWDVKKVSFWLISVCFAVFQQEAGGLEAGGLEAGGLEIRQLDLGQPISDLISHLPVLKKHYRGPLNVNVV